MNEVKRNSGASQWLKPQFIVSLILIVVLLGAVLAVVFLSRNPVVATVNGAKITRDDLYEAMYTQGGKDALDNLITKMLVLQEGKKMGITVSDAEIDEEIRRIVAEEFMGMEEQFHAILEQYGMTLDGLKKDIRMNLTVHKIVESGLEISEAEAEAYFADNQAAFNIPEEIEARHILVDTEAEAREIIAILEQGEDFAALAKERSKDTGSKDQGGNLGFFKRGSMLAEFDESAFALAVGERSEPVETDYGFHVIEVLDRKAGREVTYAAVKDQVREKMIKVKTPGLINELIMRLRGEAEIEYKN